MTDAPANGGTLRVDPLPDRADLRVPDPSAPGLEGDLGRANAARRTRAIERWAARVPGIDARRWGDEPGPGQPAMATVEPFSTDRAQGLTAGALVGRPLELDPEAEGPVGSPDPPALARLLDAGTDVTLADAADLLPDVADLGDDLAAALAAQVEVVLRLSGPAPVPSSAWFDHDTVLVGLWGERRLSLIGPADEAPVPGVSSDPTGPPAWSGSLAAGQLVVLPRGWGRVLEGSGPAGWAELRVRRLRGTDVAAFVAGRAGGALAFREDAPWDPDAVEPDPTSIFGDPDGLAARFAELDLDRLSATATAAWMAALRPVRAPTLADLDDLDGELAGPGGFVLVEGLPHDAEPLPPGSVGVAIGGHLLRVPAALAERLASLELPDDALRTLVRQGLLTPSRR